MLVLRQLKMFLMLQLQETWPRLPGSIHLGFKGKAARFDEAGSGQIGCLPGYAILPPQFDSAACRHRNQETAVNEAAMQQRAASKWSFDRGS